MSHHLRHDKNCLNCGAEVTGRYCARCGQENIEPKETVGHLVHHFVGDITHYDSKFFITLKNLLFKPGFLTREYIAGRRVHYLDPIRTYVFISVLFFIALSFKKEGAETPGGENTAYMKAARHQVADTLLGMMPPANSSLHDSIQHAVITQLLQKLDAAEKQDTTEAIGLSVGDKGVKFTLIENKYNSVEEYDSAQIAKPDSLRDKGFLRWMLRENIKLKSKYGSRSQVVLSENFEHNLPKLMFVLLPLFAWFVYILHSRRKYYYAQHAVFSIHLHSFIFVVLLLTTVIGWIFPHVDGRLYLWVPADLAILVYVVAALKTTYRQSWFAATGKTLAITVLYSISLLICIFVFAFINFFTA